MSAAITAADTGLDVTVVDDNTQPGGQIYRQPPAALAARPPSSSPDAQRGDMLRRRLRGFGDRIELLTNTRVWGVFPQKQLALSSDDGWRMIQAQRLVLATGAYEYVPPFPGWTLPGVMTPGAAQLMVKTMHVLPGQRALVVGTGPFLLVVANCLHDAGVEVVGVVEAVRRHEVIPALPGLLSDLGQLGQGWRYLRRLARAGIRLHTGHVVVGAEGDDALRRVVFAPCDRQWRPDPSRSKTVDVDALCVGYGFVPRTELAQLAGCRMWFSNPVGGWVPEVDATLQTSVPGVWVSGDGGGVAGAVVAELEGTLAGLAASRDAGAIDEGAFDERCRPVTRRLTALRRFRASLDRLSEVRPGLSSVARGDTIVCRCEELTRDDIEVGIQAGGCDIRTLKVATRLGMGPCQGRMCWPAMARYVAASTGRTTEQVGPLSARPPTMPVTWANWPAPYRRGRWPARETAREVAARRHRRRGRRDRLRGCL